LSINYPQPTPPQKPRKGLKIAAGIVGGVVALAVIGGVVGSNSGNSGSGSPTSAAAAPEIGPFTPSQYVTITQYPTPDTTTPIETTPAPVVAPAEPAVDVWEFSVTTTGSGIGSVTYMKPGFNIAQDNSVSGKKWSAKVEGDYDLPPNMNAQNKGSGTITCTIKHNGEVVTENSSKGAYAVVSCN
jgi:hypothetical protein